MSTALLIRLFLFVICLGLSALFSGSETALFSLSPIQREKLAMEGKTSSRLLKKPTELLVGILVGNTITNVLATILLTSVAIDFFGEKALVFTIPTMTFILLIAGEITPKNLGVNYNMDFVRRFSSPLSGALTVLYPFRVIFSHLLKFFLRTEVAESPTISEADFKAALKLGLTAGRLSRSEIQSLNRVLSFDRATAVEAMLPRANLKFIDIEKDDTELIDAAKQYFRFVVIYQGNVDNVVGIIPTKKLSAHKLGLPINRLIEKPAFVSFATPLGDFLDLFLKNRNQYVIVVGQHGEPIGALDFNQLMNFLVSSPFVTPGREIKRKGRYNLIPATMDIDEFNKFFSASIESAFSQTIGGYIEERIGRIPQQGEKIALGEFIFTIIESSSTRIIKMAVKKRKHD